MGSIEDKDYGTVIDIYNLSSPEKTSKVANLSSDEEAGYVSENIQKGNSDKSINENDVDVDSGDDIDNNINNDDSWNSQTAPLNAKIGNLRLSMNEDNLERISQEELNKLLPTGHDTISEAGDKMQELSITNTEKSQIENKGQIHCEDDDNVENTQEGAAKAKEHYSFSLKGELKSHKLDDFKDDDEDNTINENFGIFKGENESELNSESDFGLESEPEREDLNPKTPLANPDFKYDFTRDPSISSRISGESNVFKSNSSLLKKTELIDKNSNDADINDEYEFKNFERPLIKNNGRTSTMTSQFTATFSPPDNMNQFVNNAGYSQSVYSMSTISTDAASEFSYLPDDDKKWEVGYKDSDSSEDDISHKSNRNNNNDSDSDDDDHHDMPKDSFVPPSLARTKSNNTMFTTKDSASIIGFKANLEKGRNEFGQGMDAESIMPDLQVDHNSDNDNSETEDDKTDVESNATIDISKNIDTSMNSASSPKNDKTTASVKNAHNDLQLHSIVKLFDLPDHAQLESIRSLRKEQSRQDTGLKSWLETQMEMAKNTKTSQPEFGADIKDALNTTYSNTPANLGIGYGLSQGLDTTKSRVADVGEGFNRSMHTLGRAAKMLVRGDNDGVSKSKSIFKKKKQI
ncbi:hypothetical protein DAMA08_008190 [Martiniozyma asiatica (nom. inval.)]|nr:hypothetical protein DAMA08_008190 [Martiniozyma asiatica]